ncbi:conserved hypothetical protein, partial [Ricinus communis]
MIGGRREAVLHFGARQRRIGHQEPDIGHQPGREGPRQRADIGLEIGRIGMAEQQREAFVRIDDRHRLAMIVERDRVVAQRLP